MSTSCFKIPETYCRELSTHTQSHLTSEPFTVPDTQQGGRHYFLMFCDLYTLLNHSIDLFQKERLRGTNCHLAIPMRHSTIPTQGRPPHLCYTAYANKDPAAPLISRIRSTSTRHMLLTLSCNCMPKIHACNS